MNTVQSALLQVHIATGVNPMEILGMQRNFSYVNTAGEWVNPKPSMTLQEQLQALYESEHSFVTYVAGNPMGTQTRNGKKISSGKYMFTDEQVQAAIAYLPKVYAQYASLGVKKIGAKTEKSSSVEPSNDNVEAMRKLGLRLANGEISETTYNEMKALFTGNTTTPKTNKAIDKIRKSNVEPLTSNGNETIAKIAARKGKNGTFFITLAELKKHKIVAKYDESFTATLVHGKDNNTLTAKWVITEPRKTEVSVKQFIA